MYHTFDIICFRLFNIMIVIPWEASHVARNLYWVSAAVTRIRRRHHNVILWVKQAGGGLLTFCV